MRGLLSLFKSLMTNRTDGMLIINKRYKLQFGNDEDPLRWIQTNEATSVNHLNTPGMNDAAPMIAAVRTPATTRVVMSDDLESAILNEEPTNLSCRSA